jgi:hypothetical protein
MGERTNLTEASTEPIRALEKVGRNTVQGNSTVLGERSIAMDQIFIRK